MEQARLRARIVSLFLGVVIVFQAALIAGAPWGEWTQGGQEHGALPVSGRTMAALSILVLSVFVLGILAVTNQGPWRNAARGVMRNVTRAAAIYSALGVVMNGASRSPNERALWTPVSLVCFVLMVQVLRLTRDSESL